MTMSGMMSVAPRGACIASSNSLDASVPLRAPHGMHTGTPRDLRAKVDLCVVYGWVRCRVRVRDEKSVCRGADRWRVGRSIGRRREPPLGISRESLGRRPGTAMRWESPRGRSSWSFGMVSVWASLGSGPNSGATVGWKLARKRALIRVRICRESERSGATRTGSAEQVGGYQPMGGSRPRPSASVRRRRRSRTLGDQLWRVSAGRIGKGGPKSEAGVPRSIWPEVA